jgi:hypothetical protein
MDGEDQVFVVVDKAFGERTYELARAGLVFVIDTPLNCAAAEKVWAEGPQASHLKPVYVFESGASSPENLLLDGLDQLDLRYRHSDFLEEPPFTLLEAIGASLTTRVKAKLRKNEFEEFYATTAGFRAVRPVLTKATSVYPYDWYSLQLLPASSKERDLTRTKAAVSLELMFEKCLPARLRRDWCDERVLNEGEYKEIQSRFGEFLITQAQRAGVRLLISDRVINQLIEWSSSEKGVIHLTRFFDALMQNAKAGIGKAKIDVADEDWLIFKNGAVAELKELQTELRDASAKRTRTEPPGMKVAAMITNRPGAYSRLLQNLVSLNTFCDRDPSTCTTFIAGITKPAAFFDLWGAWATNHTPETFRRAVSLSGSKNSD